MRRTLLFFAVLILAAIIFIAGGGDKKPAVSVTKTNAFGFIQEVPNQSGTFNPMLGQYVSSGGTTCRALRACRRARRACLKFPLLATPTRSGTPNLIHCPISTLQEGTVTSVFSDAADEARMKRTFS
jgi:hypothetical protein